MLVYRLKILLYEHTCEQNLSLCYVSSAVDYWVLLLLYGRGLVDVTMAHLLCVVKVRHEP